MAKTNSKDGNSCVEQSFHFAHDVVERGGIAGAVREKNSGGLVLERIGGRSRRGQNLRGEAVLPQAAEDVVFHPVIKRDNRNVGRRHGLADVAGVGGFYSANEIKRGAMRVLFIPTKFLFVCDFLDVIPAAYNKFLGSFHRFLCGNFLGVNKSVKSSANDKLF